MNRELKALETIKNIPILSTPESTQKIFYDKHKKELDIIENTLKNQKRKLDLISEVLVDVSKGNYADLNDAINEIREVLESE